MLLLVYAVNSLDSFESLKALSWELKDKFDVGEELNKVIVATHADLPEENWAVSQLDGSTLARSRGCDFVITSAVDGRGVDQVFDPYVSQVIARREESHRLWSLRYFGLDGPPKDRPKKKHSWQYIKGKMAQILARQ